MKKIVKCIIFGIFSVSCNKDSGLSKKKEETSSNNGNPSNTTTDEGQHIQILGQLAVSDGIDTAITFTVAGPSLKGVSSEKVPVQAGALSIDVLSQGQSLVDDTPESTVVMVLGDKESRLDAFDSISFVSAPTVGEEKLIGLATGSVKSKQIELGTIAKEGEDLVGSENLGAETFTLSEETLAETAKLDDALRVLKNDWVNPPSEEGSIASAIEFYFEGDLRNAVDKSTALDDITMLGWSPFLSANHSAFTYDVLCDSTKPTFKNFTYKLPSPGAKRTIDGAYETELTNSGAQPNQTSGVAGRKDCGAGTSYIGGGTPDNPSVFMNFGSGVGFVTEVPKGAFEVILGGKTYAKFDLAVSWPLIKHPSDPTKNVPQIYVPSLEIKTDSTSGKVSSIEVRLHLFDRVTKTYHKVTDYNVLKNVVETLSIGVEEKRNNSSPTSENKYFGANSPFPNANEPFTMTAPDFTKDWRIKA
ncbi:MAG: hypothetical protein NTX25_03130 [Proteobacteria bacterium]|nr:hypothetical protein [Pseudomonadota bacterium]